MNSFHSRNLSRFMPSSSQILKVSAAVLLLLTPLFWQSASAQSESTQTVKPIVEAIGATTGVPKGTSGYEKWMMFRDRVAAASGGEIEITPMVTGGLGSEENILNSLRRGRIQVANLSGLVIGTLAPEVALLQAPYLFDEQAEADYVYDTVLFGIFKSLLSEYGLTFLSWDEVGFHHIYGKKPILSPADAADTRFRISSGLPAQLFARAIDADVIPLSFNENVVGLQTGLVDAGANAIILYASAGIAEEAPHLSMTGHIFATNFVITSTRWLEGLSPEHQDIITTSWVPIDTARAMSRDEETGFMNRADDIGFTVHALSPEQRTAWKRAAGPVTKQIIEAVGGRSQEIFDAIQAGKAAYQAQRSIKGRE